MSHVWLTLFSVTSSWSRCGPVTCHTQSSLPHGSQAMSSGHLSLSCQSAWHYLRLSHSCPCFLVNGLLLDQRSTSMGQGPALSTAVCPEPGAQQVVRQELLNRWFPERDLQTAGATCKPRPGHFPTTGLSMSLSLHCLAQKTTQGRAR